MDRVGCGLWNIVIVKRPRVRETEKKKKKGKKREKKGKKGKRGRGGGNRNKRKEGERIIEMRRDGRRDRCETTGRNSAGTGHGNRIYFSFN